MFSGTGSTVTLDGGRIINMSSSSEWEGLEQGIQISGKKVPNAPPIINTIEVVPPSEIK